MADSVFNIAIRATSEVGNTLKVVKDDLKRVKAATEELNRGNEADEVSASYRELGESAKQGASGTNEFADSTKNLTTALPKLVRFLKLAAGGFLAFKSVQTAKGFADTAARAEVLGTVLRITARNAGLTSEAIQEMEQQVSSLGITTSATRDSLAKLISAGLITQESTFRAAELAQAAQDLAVTAGTNSSQTFQRLIVNIQQLDSVGLRYQGLVVDRAKAERELQRQIGATGRELTKQEKQLAFYNAVIEETTKLSGAYTESMTNVGKQLGSLARLQETVSENVGNILLPAYSAIVEVFSDFLKELIKITKSLDESGTFADALGKSVRVVAEVIKNAVLILIEFREVLFALAAGYATLKGLQVAYAVGTKAAGLATKLFAIDIAGLTKGMTGLKLATLSVTTAVGGLKAAIASTGIGLLVIGLASLAAYLAFRPKDKGKTGLSESVEALNEEIKEFKESQPDQEGILEFAKRINTDILKGREEVTQLRGKLTEARAANERLQTAESQAAVDFLVGEIERLEEADKQLLNSRERLLAVANKATREATTLDLDDRTSEVQKQAKAFIDAQTALEEAQSKLAPKASTEVLGVSKSFEEMAASLRKVQQAAVNPVFDTLNGEARTLEVNLVTLINGYRELANTSSPKELALLISQLTGDVIALSPELEKVYQQLTRKYAESFVSQLNKDFEQTATKVQTYLTSIRRLSSLQSEQASDQNDLTQALLRFGASALQAEKGVAKLADNFADLKEGARQLREAGIDRVRTEMASLSSVYEQDTRALSQSTEANRSLLRQQADDFSALRAAEEKLLRESRQQQLALDEQYYQSLRQLRAAALSEYEQSLQTIAQLENELTQINRSEAQFLEDLRREKLTGEERYQDNLRLLREKASQETLARERGDFEEARRINDDRLALAKDLVAIEQQTEARGEVFKAEKEGVDKVKEAYESRRQTVKAEAVEVEDSAKRQRKVYEDLTKQIEKAATAIAKVSADNAEATVKFFAQQDEASFQKLKDELRQFEDIPTIAPVEVELNQNSVTRLLNDLRQRLSQEGLEMAGGGLVRRRFATGGWVRGPGTSTSDSIPAWLSNNEFVMSAKAVRHWGVDFMNSLNAMQLPKFQFGGYVNRMTPAYSGFNTGGLVSTPRASSGPVERVQVDLRYGDDTFTLMGEKAETRRLVNALRKTNRGA